MTTISYFSRYLLGATLISLWCFTAYAQTKQVRNVGTFEGIEASGALQLFVKQGAKASVEVEADEDLQSHILVEVQGKTLKIYRDKKFQWDRWGNKKVNVYITCTSLNQLSASGATSVKGESDFITNDLELRVSGASNITMSISAKSLNAEASGASSIKLTGRAERQRIDLSGASNYQAFDLQSMQADVEASGASRAHVQVEQKLKAEASGASGVRYKGNPQVRDVQSSGASSIKSDS